jgi:hypothetical protein
MAKRTVLRFETHYDIWPVVEDWAKGRDYREKARGETWRRYQQGYGLLVLPKMVEVRQEGTAVEVQGWVRNFLLNRIMLLFLMPAEMDLGKGFLAVVPRSTARRDVNVLLEKLGQPPIGT